MRTWNLYWLVQENKSREIELEFNLAKIEYSI